MSNTAPLIEEPAKAQPAVKFSARLLSLILPFKANRDIRWYLQGVNLRPHAEKGVLLAATNGHHLAVAYDAEGVTDREYILEVTPALQRSVGTRAARTVEREGARLLVRGEYEQELFIQPGKSEIEAKYPRWEKVMPADPTQLVPHQLGGWFAGSLIERVAALARRSGSRVIHGNESLAFWSVPVKPGEQPGAAYARFAAEPNVLAVVMPRRDCDDVAGGIPAWLKVAA